MKEVMGRSKFIFTLTRGENTKYIDEEQDLLIK